MGEVYRALDVRLRREVALKVLPAEVSANEDRLKRFEREARAASALNHPNIVTVYDIGVSEATSYIAIELVTGKSLSEVIAHGVLPLRQMLEIGSQIADGLAAAHEAGIIHRDLKPANVMLSNTGLVKVVDFGLAKVGAPYGADTPSDGETITDVSHGVVLGTVGYMSPEQARGEQVDFRTDQFSLGCVLYEMAAGRRPFTSGTPSGNGNEADAILPQKSAVVAVDRGTRRGDADRGDGDPEDSGRLDGAAVAAFRAAPFECEFQRRERLARPRSDFARRIANRVWSPGRRRG
ncbi:MAG: serine/threonine protein kinase [Acidobacteria bacterium]|nr:serine/threonine protein kinase [Acidobacteriota bacterium]